NLGATLFDIIVKMAQMVLSFNNAVLSGGGIKGVFDALGKSFSWVGDRIGDLVGQLGTLTGKIGEVWDILRTGEAAANGSFDKDSKIVKWLVAISDAAKSVVNSIGSIEISLSPITSGIGKFFAGIGT